MGCVSSSAQPQQKESYTDSIDKDNEKRTDVSVKPTTTDSNTASDEPSLNNGKLNGIFEEVSDQHSDHHECTVSDRDVQLSIPNDSEQSFNEDSNALLGATSVTSYTKTTEENVSTKNVNKVKEYYEREYIDLEAQGESMYLETFLATSRVKTLYLSGAMGVNELKELFQIYQSEDDAITMNEYVEIMEILELSFQQKIEKIETESKQGVVLKEQVWSLRASLVAKSKSGLMV